MSFGTVQAEKMTTESGYSLGAGNASSFKNRIINGNMTIWQRGASVAASSTAYGADRWNVYISGSGGFTSAQSTDVPAGAGFTYSNLCTVTSAATPGESGVTQYVEGYNFADANWGTASAESVTVSFWVKSSLTGTFVFVLRSTNGTYSYLAPYTINAANTWEQKTITIPGLTSQVPNFTNGYALIFEFALGGNGNATSTTNTWLSGNYFNLTGSVNVIGTLGATFSFTGVQLELGTVATSFDYRSYQNELGLCQRYYEVNGNMYCRNTGTTAQEIRITWVFKTEKRTSPTITVGTGASTGVSIYCGTVYQSSVAAGAVYDTSAQLTASAEF